MSTSQPNQPQGGSQAGGESCPSGSSPMSSGAAGQPASSAGRPGQPGTTAGSAGAQAGAAYAQGMGQASQSMGGSSSEHWGERSGATNRLHEKAGDLRQDLEELGTAARDAAQERFEHLRSTANEYMQQGRERVTQFEETLETQIREQPLRSLLIASGIGFFLGVIMRRH